MSFTFDEVCALRKGDTVWESDQCGNLQVTLLTDPEVTADEEYPQVRFEATIVGSQDDARNGETVNYLMTKGLDYGPKLYLVPAYVNIDTLQPW